MIAVVVVAAHGHRKAIIVVVIVVGCVVIGVGKVGRAVRSDRRIGTERGRGMHNVHVHVLGRITRIVVIAHATVVDVIEVGGDDRRVEVGVELLVHVVALSLSKPGKSKSQTGVQLGTIK